jgi:hypothetical protein
MTEAAASPTALSYRTDIVTLPAGDDSLRRWSCNFHDGTEGRG